MPRGRVAVDELATSKQYKNRFDQRMRRLSQKETNAAGVRARARALGEDVPELPEFMRVTPGLKGRVRVRGIGSEADRIAALKATRAELAALLDEDKPRPRGRVRVGAAAPQAPAETETAQDTAFAVRQKAAEARAKYLQLCRVDINTFCEYVLIDDGTGEAVTQNEFHCRLQSDLTKHRQMVLMSHPESGKTSQFVGRVLFALGNNPNLRIMWLCNAEESAMQSLSTIRRYIEDSARLHEVFPNLKRGEIWKDDSIIVSRTNYSRDPSVRAVGYNSRRIQGSRVDFLIIDDLLDAMVTATEAQRRKLSSWLKSTVFTRLTESAMVAFLTNAWHPRDAAHELVRDRGWHLIKRPIRNPDGKIWWHRWSEERLKIARKSMGALEYARSYECDPRDDGSRVFRPEHVEAALARGKGYGFVRAIRRMPRGSIVVTGVDLATGDTAQVKKQQGAKTVITSVFFHPNQDRQVIRIRAGRWRARKIIEELSAVAEIFPENHWIVVENNGVQRWILELAAENQLDVGVALVPFQTGRNKSDPTMGVASMAAEFEGFRWILPADCESEEEQNDVESLVAQAIDYVPEAHTGDYLMSVWFAREIGRKIFKRISLRIQDEEGSEGSSVTIIG